MIKTQKQYNVTAKLASQLKETIEQAKGNTAPPGCSEQMYDTQLQGMEAMLSKMEAELAEFRRLSSGDVSAVRLRDWIDLPKAIIGYRIAQGMSQTELARHLGVKSQQVQRWEAVDNHTASFAVICEMARVLRVQFPAARDADRVSALPSTELSTTVSEAEDQRAIRWLAEGFTETMMMSSLLRQGYAIIGSGNVAANIAEHLVVGGINSGSRSVSIGALGRASIGNMVVRSGEVLGGARVIENTHLRGAHIIFSEESEEGTTDQDTLIPAFIARQAITG